MGGHQAQGKQEAHSFSPALPLQHPLLTKLHLHLAAKDTHMRAQVHFHRQAKRVNLGLRSDKCITNTGWRLAQGARISRPSPAAQALGR